MPDDTTRPGRPLHFTSRLEMETRPKFDHDCLITADNYDGLIGDYVLPVAERIRCRVLRVRNPCRTLHGIGFLAVIKGGAEGYIGCDCKATRRWGNDSRFAQDSAQLMLEREIDDLLERHAAATADASIQTRVTQACTTHNALWADISALRRRLPGPVFLRLLDMVKRGRTTVTVEVAYRDPPEKPGHPPPPPRWTEQAVGTIRAAESLATSVDSLGKRLHAIRDALAADVIRDTPRKALQKLMREIEGLQDIERKLEERSRSLEQFREPSNLAHCALLATSYEDQRAILALAYSLGKSAAEQARIELYARIRMQFGDRDFRVI